MSLSPYISPALSDDDVAPVQVLDYVLRCGITLSVRCIACSGVVLLLRELSHFRESRSGGVETTVSVHVFLRTFVCGNHHIQIDAKIVTTLDKVG